MAKVVGDLKLEPSGGQRNICVKHLRERQG